MFAAPFPSYGLMVIADCGHGDSVILAGMNHLDVAQGELLVHGQPIGTMEGFDPAKPAHQPRLYVELRQNGQPVDPAPWLNGGHSG
jgi:septal ring factor EnvC (AmiA/AmiB activator)